MAHKKILVGLDGSDGAFRALEEAVALARLFGAELHAISVQEIPFVPGGVRDILESHKEMGEWLRSTLLSARQTAENAGIALKTTMLAGHEVKSILDFTKDGSFDLLVIGFAGRSAIQGLGMGSTCQALVRLAPCTVLVVK